MRAKVNDEGGQALILIAIVTLGMIFAVGLAIDAGQLFNGRRTAQEAADAAAFGGATALYQNGTPAQATDAATADAARNGYATNVPTSGTAVIVTTPPTSGSYAGNPLCVQVVISTPVRTSLVPQEAGVTTVRATGTGCSVSSSFGYAVMATDQACDSGTVALSSNGSLTITGGGIEINSCSPIAGQSSVTISLQPGYYTDVVGNVDVSSSFPNLRTGRAVQPDPFAGLPKPSTNGLPTYSPACAPTINQPGIYTTSFSSNCEYVFAPGTYVLANGGFNLTGNSSACTGHACATPTADGGVFFFLTNANYPASGGSCASFKLEGGNVSTLSAPTGGTYQGMLIWQDGVCTNPLSIGGGAAITMTGSIYAPGAAVTGNGNGAIVNASQIIAKKVDTQGANFTIVYSNAITYHGKVPALVE